MCLLVRIYNPNLNIKHHSTLRTPIFLLLEHCVTPFLHDMSKCSLTPDREGRTEQSKDNFLGLSEAIGLLPELKELPV